MLKSITTAMRLVLPFGFYGAGNIGDEATLKGFSKLLAHVSRPASVWVGSMNPGHTRHVAPEFRYFHNSQFDLRRVYAKRRATAFAVAGGTPIQDVLGVWPLNELRPHLLSLDRLNIPMAFVGVGVESLEREESRRIVREDFAPRVSHWSVRTTPERDRLIEYGVSPERVTVGADMAWLLEAPTKEYGAGKLREWGIAVGQQPIIAINMANENHMLDEHPELLASIARALDELARDQRATLLFLCAETREDDTFDKAAAQKIIAALPRPDIAFLAPNDYLRPSQLMSIIANCQLSVSMRFHFCLFNALTDTPFIAIERTGKVRDLCADLHWDASVSPSALDADVVIAHGRRLMSDAPRLMETVHERVLDIRERAMRNSAALASLGRG